MKTYALGVIVSGLLVACGGGGESGGDDTTDSIDAADDPLAIDASDNLGACNPLSPAGEQGCAADQKCTWIEIADTPEEIGRLGCVPDGSVGLGAACTRGAVGEATGYDNCAAGGICIGGATAGVCKDVCGFDGGSLSSCVSGETCTRYSGLGANGDDDPVIGACNPSCDPLTQTRMVGDTPQSCGAGQGCYLLASTADTVAVCAAAGTPTHNQAIVGATFANSCAPGHVPRQAVQGVAGNECAALCKPATVYNGMNDGREGRPDYEGGDSRAMNWSGHEATCLGGTMTEANPTGDTSVLPNVGGTGESCTFYWTREPSLDVTAFSNTLGWCFNHASWKYDPDGMEPVNNIDDYPRCVSDGVTVGAFSMTTGDLFPPVDAAMPHNDAVYFGCSALPTELLPGGSSEAPWQRPEPIQLDRLGSYKH